MTQATHICPRCGWSDTRPSASREFFDAFLCMFLLVPIRCRRCLNRFFRFRTAWAKYVVPLAVLSLALLLGSGFRVLRSVTRATRFPGSAVRGTVNPAAYAGGDNARTH